VSEAIDFRALIRAAGAALEAGRVSEAEALARLAVASAPTSSDAQMALGLVLLSAGRYAEAWPHYERRRANRPALPFREWDGRPVARLAVWGEQGLGDQIQFARFVPVLIDRGVDVTLLCHPGLERLFSQLGANVIPMCGPVEFPDPDAWVLGNSLPCRLGVTMETLPAAPYLSAAPRGCGGIGIAPAGNAGHPNDSNRSLPADAAAQLLSLPGAIDLRPESTGARDFQDTAEIVAGLSLVISVDTSIAHLAGAMGKPCWVLLPYTNPDWRWGIGRIDSPWYPSLRLIRQPQAGDWNSVLSEISRLVAQSATLRTAAVATGRQAPPKVDAWSGD
jgi:hypothetical protein